MVKVCFISHYAELYGANKSLLGLLSEAQKFDVDPRVVLREKGEMAVQLEKLNVPYKVIPFHYILNPKVFKYSIPYFWRFLNRWEKRIEVRERDRDNAKAIREVISSGFVNGVDLIYTNTSVVGVGKLLADELSIPHIFHIRENAGHHYNWESDHGDKAYRKMLASSHHVNFVSQYLMDTLQLPVSTSQKVIYNGVMSESDAIGLNSSPSSSNVFSLVGLIHQNKGQREAILALDIVLKSYSEDVKLVLVGGGNKVHLKDLCRSLGVHDHVEFHGFTPDVSSIYINSLATLACSKHEGFGRVVAESMMFGRPVIAVRSGAYPELIEDGKDGFLVDDTPEDIAKGMIRVLKDREKAHEIGIQGRKKAIKTFTIEQNARLVFEGVNQILMSRG